MHTIYLLSDPRDGVPRYVGVTSRVLDARLKQHRANANSGVMFPVYIWYRKLLKLGLSPVVTVLEHASERSREAHRIAHYRSNFRMLNVADGGNDAPSSNPDVAAKIAASLRGRKLPAEVIARGVAARAGFKHSEETRMKMRKPKTAVHRENAKQAMCQLRSRGGVNSACGERNGMRKHPASVLRGKLNAQARLTENDVIEMRRLFSGGIAAAELSRQYGISTTGARRVVLGITWSHLPGAGAPRGKGRRT